jgi:drug/metabolite transporter (DMT)-like permease
MIGVLLSLVPLIGWGTGDYIAAKSTKQVSGFSIGFFFSIVGWLFVTPVSLAYGLPSLGAREFLLFLLSTICINAGFLLMLRGFKNGPTGLVAPIANAYAVITALSGWLLFNNSLGLKDLLGICIVVLGIATVSYLKPKKGEFKNRYDAILSAVLALIIFGLGFTLFGEAAKGKWHDNSLVFQSLNLMMSFIIFMIFQKKNKLRDFKRAAKYKLNYLGGICGSVGAMALFGALNSFDSVAIPAAIAAAAPLVTALLAYLLDKEHLTMLQRFATVIIVSGIILLNI